jgi:hypothetical protein
MGEKIFFVIAAILFFLRSIDLAEAPPPPPGPRPKAPTRERELEERRGIPDDPAIREFSANPTSVVQGGSVTLRWGVEPGMSSPINRIRVTLGDRELFFSADTSGEYRYTLPSDIRPGRTEFELTATNQIGRSKSRSVSVNIIADEPIIRSFSAYPTSVIQGERVNFSWRVEVPPGGSLLDRVTITLVGVGAFHSSSTGSGEYPYSIAPTARAGTTQFFLTATNQAGRFVTRTIEVRIIGRLNFRIESLTTEPREFSSAEPVRFFITGVNESGDLRNVSIVIDCEGNPPMTLGPFPIVLSGGFRTNTTEPIRVYPGNIRVEVRCGDQVSRTEFRTETITRYRIAR